MAQGHDLAGAKHLGRIGLGTNGTQVGSRNVVDVERQNLKGQSGVALLAVDPAPVAQGGIADLGIAFWQVKASIGRQAFEQDFAEALALK